MLQLLNSTKKGQIRIKIEMMFTFKMTCCSVGFLLHGASWCKAAQGSVLFKVELKITSANVRCRVLDFYLGLP